MSVVRPSPVARSAPYIGLTSGQYISCDVQDDFPNKCHQNVPSIFSQLDAQGVSWTESAANPCHYDDSGSGWAFNIYGARCNPVCGPSASPD